MTCSRIDQNWNALIMDHTFDFNHIRLMICLLMVQRCINSGHTSGCILYCIFLLNVMCSHCVVSLLREKPLEVISSTSPTFNRLPFPYSLRLGNLAVTGDSLSLLKWISPKRGWFKPLLSLILMILLLIFPRSSEVYLSFTLLIHMLGLSDFFLQRLRFIILNLVFVKGG